MALFEFGKEEQGVKVLGGGCKKCDQLESAAIEALESLGMDRAGNIICQRENRWICTDRKTSEL